MIEFGAHLTMGEASGDMKTAISAVTAGEEMTATLQAKYMAAGMNRRDATNRQQDDGDVAGALDGVSNTAVDEKSAEKKTGLRHFSGGWS